MPITAYGGSSVLALLLPGASDRYIALYEDAECTTEIAVPGYARVAYAGWATTVDGLKRSNTAPISWSVFTSGGEFAGIAVVDAATLGNQLVIASVKNLFDESTVIVDPGDYPEIAIGTMRVEIG